MKKQIILLFALALLAQSCQRSAGAVWKDTKTLRRYLQRSGKLLMKQDPDSRLFDDPSQLIGPDAEFIALDENDILFETTDIAMPQPKNEPGKNGAPHIDFFKEPSGELASIFQMVHFDTDKHVFTNSSYQMTVDRIANYMNHNKDYYVFVMGHCDERASEAYNLALGTRRANYVRSLLIKKGVDSNKIYSVSFGKETPLDQSHSKEAWAKNRRVEFKLYQSNGNHKP